MKTISFIGGGRISKILIQGFKKAGIDFQKMVVFDVNTDVLSSLKKKFPYVTTTDIFEDVFGADIIFWLFTRQ